MITHAQKARNYFLEGYNCAQSVFLAFTDLTGIDEKTALLISSSFGGGMGRLREVCGAVSGMFMAAGILYGYTDPKSKTEKMEHYKRIQDLAEKFRERNGSIVCRDILGKIADDKSFIPADRTAEYYKTRPCAKMVEDAAEILDRYIEEYPIK
ncbi:MAG: C_GCAxxG_C_C family protein [Ruminiclostridium sp.]|nr:C_GCAxxG_C_C family protein [Ruminiclostridium sp.]